MPCDVALPSQVSEDEGGVGALDDGGEGISKALSVKAKKEAARKRRESRKQRDSVAASVVEGDLPSLPVPVAAPAPKATAAVAPSSKAAPAGPSVASAAAAALVSPIAIAASGAPSTLGPLPQAPGAKRGPAPKVAAPAAPSAPTAAGQAPKGGVLSSALPSIGPPAAGVRLVSPLSGG
jgi:hypothetical protein